LTKFLGHRPWSSPEAAARYAQAVGSSDYPRIVAVNEAPGQPEPSFSPADLSQRNRLICRQVALKAAVELAEPGTSPDQVLGTAEAFYT